MRSSLADAAWTVEDRVVWGGADRLRDLGDVVRGPLERVAWATEERLVWPIREEAALWGRPARVGAAALAIILAAAGLAAGIAVSGSSSGTASPEREALGSAAAVTTGSPSSARRAKAPKVAAVGAGAAVLHGAKPDFVPEGGGGVSPAQASSEAQGSSSSGDTASSSASSTASASASSVAAARPNTGSGSDIAGPGAIKVARKFAGAFVLYETGRADSNAKATIRRTATSDLAKALLKRPPRLPADAKVPKAKVLNIVAGPRHGDAYTLSASLLRVGVTSELKIDMTKTRPGGAGSIANAPGSGKARRRLAGRSATSSAEGTMSRLRGTFALVAFAALLAASSALAAEMPGPADPAMPPASSATAPATGPADPVAPATQAPSAATGLAGSTAGGQAGAPAQQGSGAKEAEEGGSSVKKGATLEAPPASAPQSGGSNGKESTGGTGAGQAPGKPAQPATEGGGTEGALPPPSEPFQIPSIPSSSCAGSGVPPVLIPIYQRAAAAYGLGPQGPAVLAGINEIETAFGSNLNVSSAGAMGWMQFIPSTWEGYGVDANGDGVRDPYNPEDAIFAAANYLSAAGMPADTYGAIYAYNHADWYVAEVLANAACYSGIGGAAPVGGFSLEPQLQVLSCRPAEEWRKTVPESYMAAFETAAARYELGRKGVWALAAVARLESNFGRGMDRRQLQKFGPLGLDGSEWRTYAVDGDEDGHIRRADPADSAATLARLIWSRGGLRAGIFTHNQAHWYVEAVMAQAEEVKGGCKLRTVDWSIALPASAPAAINWQNLHLSNELEARDLADGAIDPRIVALIAAITQEHELTISALRSDHSRLTASGNVSNHYFGRAMDIAAVDGVPCTDTAIDAPCASLARTLAYLPAPVHPTELIYCFDVDGPGPAFALPDHCDHVHAGFYG